jgi:hypothetical protein
MSYRLFKYSPPGSDAATTYFAPWFIRVGPPLGGWEFDFKSGRCCVQPDTVVFHWHGGDERCAGERPLQSTGVAAHRRSRRPGILRREVAGLKCKKKDDAPTHHHERLAQKVKKLEARIARLERHQHRTVHGDFTDEPWFPQEGKTC